MYVKVIVAIDLSEASEKVVSKALELVADDAGKLAIAHVVEPIPPSWGTEAYAINPLDFQQRIMDYAQTRIGEIGSKAGINESQLYISLGIPIYEIRKLAKDLNADAIVIGSHGHGGWELWLGSTSNKVLHGATCDVLTVHIAEG
jgi:universal stress protein A